MLERVCGAIGCGKRHRFSRSTATTQPRHGGFFGWVFDGANAAGSSSSSLAPTSVQPTSRPTLPPLRTRRNVIAHQLRAGARALNVNVCVCVCGFPSAIMGPCRRALPTLSLPHCCHRCCWLGSSGGGGGRAVFGVRTLCGEALKSSFPSVCVCVRLIPKRLRNVR